MVNSVMLLDDDDDDIFMITDCLLHIDKNLRIAAFNDPEDALDKLLAGKIGIPDYVFIDINMPKIMGPQCLEIIRAHKAFDYSVITMISTTLSAQDAVKYTSRGANFTVQKPSKLEEYCRLLADIIGINV